MHDFTFISSVSSKLISLIFNLKKPLQHTKSTAKHVLALIVNNNEIS